MAAKPPPFWGAVGALSALPNFSPLRSHPVGHAADLCYVIACMVLSTFQPTSSDAALSSYVCASHFVCGNASATDISKQPLQLAPSTEHALLTVLTNAGAKADDACRITMKGLLSLHKGREALCLSCKATEILAFHGPSG